MLDDWLALARAHRYSRREWSPREALLARDRRIFYRVPIRVACRMNSRLFGLEASGTAIDISLGGAGLVAPISWPEGSQIRIWIDEYRWAVDCVICFRVGNDQEFRYGVKFFKMTFPDLIRLRRILRERYSGPLAVA